MRRVRYIPSEDIQEVRIFRTRLIRVKENNNNCPAHLREEISQIVQIVSSVKQGNMEIYSINRSIMPIVNYFLEKNTDFEEMNLSDNNNLPANILNRLIEILREL